MMYQYQFPRSLRPLLVMGCFWATVTYGGGRSLAEEPAQVRPAGDETDQGQVDFERDLLPVLRRNCLACHSQSEAEASLVLESAQTAVTGGDSGPAIVPGDPEESLLYLVASHRVEPFMPPPDNDVGAKRLESDQLMLLKRWIEQGARATSPEKTKHAEHAEQILWKAVPDAYAPIYALDVSPDGQLVAAGRGSQLVLYSVNGKRELQRLNDPNLKSADGAPRNTAHLDVVQSVAFSPDGQYLASGGFRCVKIWQRAPIVRSSAFALPEVARAVTATPQGDSLAFCFSGHIQLRDAHGEVLAESDVEAEELVAVTFLDADQLVTCGKDQRIQIRSATDLTVLSAWSISGSPAEIEAAISLQGGDLLVVASDDGVVRTWRRSEEGQFSPEIEREFRVGQPGKLRHVVAASDHLLAVADDQGGVHVWHALEGRQEGQINAGGPLRSMAISPDGRRLVTLLEDGTGKLWNVENGELVRELPRNMASRASVATATREVGLKKERQRVAGADLEEANKRKTEWDKGLESSRDERKKAEQDLADKQKSLEKAAQHTKEREQLVNRLQESIAAANEEITAIAASLESLEEGDPEAKRQALEQQRDQQKQALHESEGELKKAKQELDKAREQEEKEKQALATAQTALDAASAAIDRAEKSVERAAEGLAAATKDAEKAAEELKISESHLAQIKQRASEAVSHLEQAVFSSDAWRLCLRDRQGRVSVVTSESGAPLDLWEDMSAGTLLTAGADRVLALAEQTVTSWNVARSWTLSRMLGNPTDEEKFVDRVTALSFSEDSAWLATGGGEPSRSGEVQLWHVSDWQPAAVIRDAHSDVVYDLEFSPQGDYLASCSSDRMVRLIDLATAEPVKSFEGHTGHVLGVSWRAGGRTLATAGADRVVKVWDVKDGTQRKTISGFQKEITGVRFLGLEDRLVFAVGDGQVMSRNSNGDGRPAFPGYSDYVHRISSSQDGAIIAAAGQDGIVRLWDADGKELVEFGDD